MNFYIFFFFYKCEILLSPGILGHNEEVSDIRSFATLRGAH